MIASYSCNFIFLKTRKTAGSSLEIVLSSWCDGPDICSLISAEDERTRRRFGAQPRNFCRDPAWEEKFLAAIASDDSKIMDEIWPHHVEQRSVHAHMPAREVRALLPDLWPQAFKFAVERHPYEKAVSLAWWSMHLRTRWNFRRPFTFDKRRGFREALDSIVEHGRYRNHPIYMIDDAVAVDEIIPYDRLWERMHALADKYGKSIPATLPRANGYHRLDRRPAAEVLSDRQKKKIYNDARIEFELLGFKP